MRTKHHMAVNIQGLLNFHGRKKIRCMEDDDGNPVSDAEARAYLAECQAKGYKLIPRTDCEGFDPFGKGCPGHPVKEEEANN
jgi:hypothetical protein